MFRARIKLSYRQVIDAKAESMFEKAIFRASYYEFGLKSQAYNPEGRFTTFSEMQANDGRANSMHYKLGFSVLHFFSLLDKKIPLLTDTHGNKVCFETPRFELIESNIHDINQHQLAIYYDTGILTLIDFLGEYLLLTADSEADRRPVKPFIIPVQSDLSIISYQAVA